MKFNYNKNQFIEALLKVGLKKGDVVFSHSNVGYFGIPETGNTPKSMFDTIFGAFREIIGEEGTLVVPTFTYSFCRGEPFDPDNSPSTCGIFTEMVRLHSQAYRSEDPIFSVAAIGARAKELTCDVPIECFGPDSFWDRFHKMDGIICNLNFDAGSTFIHFVEKTLEVPYRYDKLFTGTFIIKGKKKKGAAIYFVSDLSNPDTRAAFEPFDKIARERGAVKSASVGRGAIVSIRAKCVYNLIKREIKNNPWFLTEAFYSKREPDLIRPSDIDHFNIVLSKNASMSEMINSLWKLPRDIISDGYDAALYTLAKQIPMTIHEYPTGTKCWTWIIPEKWTCREGYLETLDGKRLFSYADNPLHVVSYSLPYEGVISREELFKHLYTHPQMPNVIPYIAKNYERDWGLCCSKELKNSLKDEKYTVVIKTDFSYGTLKVGEVIVPGESDDYILLCAHLCHPAMANDDLSGVAIGVEVMRELLKEQRSYYTYILLILPETIGSVAYLSHHEELISKIKWAIFLEMLGNNDIFSLQLTKQGDTKLDRISRYVIKSKFSNFREGNFGEVVVNDDMILNGPGVNIPTVSISRANYWRFGSYPEYHTSADTPNIISEKSLNEAKEVVLDILRILKSDYIPKRNFKGLVFLSRYGLIDQQIIEKFNGDANYIIDMYDKMMNSFEGNKSIFDIAEDLKMDFFDALGIVDKFLDRGLIIKKRAELGVK